MTMNKKEAVSIIALQRILVARDLPKNSKRQVRNFLVPKLNFAATDYFDIIDWKQVELFSPLILDGFICTTFQSRKCIPKLKKKAEFPT